MKLKTLKNQLITHEGIRLKPYRCPAGKLTIGVGRNLNSNGINRKEALCLLENDIVEVLSDLNQIFCDFRDYPEKIQLVLADMRFNLGPDKFRDFKKMIYAVKVRNWQNMVAEMINSKWFTDVKSRAPTLIEMVRSVENDTKTI